tara:strand:- start:2961 stop:3152 length:192 start_codon:yes stop_codon:yes gene_type:complete
MEKDKNKSEEEQPWIHESEIVKKIRELGLESDFVKTEDRTERMIALTEVFSKHYKHLHDRGKN